MLDYPMAKVYVHHRTLSFCTPDPVFLFLTAAVKHSDTKLPPS